MKFTSGEVKFIEGYIQKLEKQASRWKTKKIMAVMLFLIGIWIYSAHTHFLSSLWTREANELDQTPVAVQKLNCTISEMQGYVLMEVFYLRNEILLHIEAITILFLMTIPLVWMFSSKNKDKQDLLLAKFLKDLLENKDK